MVTLTLYIIILSGFGFGFACALNFGGALVSYRTLASAAPSFLDFLAGVQLVQVSTKATEQR